MKRTFIFIASVLFLLSGYWYYQYKQTVIDQIAKKAFWEAVNDEAYKRMSDTELVIGILSRKELKEDRVPKYIILSDDSGERKEYKIDSEKHLKNVTMNADVRLIHSYAFEGRPLDIDSLNLAWENYLVKENLVCRAGMHIFLTGRDGKTISLNTSDSESYDESLLLGSCTIGHRCEMECLLYLQYSLWQIIGLVGICYVLLYFLFMFTMYKLITVIRKKMNPEKIVVEKIVLVNNVNSTTRVYSLGGNLVFDAIKRELREGENVVTLTNQPAELLELFLQKDDYVLSIHEIEKALWDVGSNYENRIYQLVNRLRVFLKPFSSLNVDKESVGAYRLIISNL